MAKNGVIKISKCKREFSRVAGIRHDAIKELVHHMAQIAAEKDYAALIAAKERHYNRLNKKGLRQ